MKNIAHAEGQEPQARRGKNHVKQRLWLGSLRIETSADGP